MKKNNGNLRKKKSFFLNKYINGTKGAISLFMALVISPLLSLSLVLVESARYQNAVALVEELSDSAAFSTLAEYDSFLDERFGLLAVSQETDIDSSFNDYLESNENVVKNHVTISEKSAVGDFALSNTHVLKQQVLEASELSVPAETTINAINLEELMEKLEEALGIDELADDIKAMKAGIDVAKEVESLLETLIKTIDHYNNKYKPSLNTYSSNYTAFADAVTDYVDALKALEIAEEAAAEAEQENTEGENDEEVEEANEELAEKQEEAQEAADTLDDAIAAYMSSNENVSEQLSDMKDYVDDLLSSLEGIPEKLRKFEDEISADSLTATCTTSAYDWLLIITNQAITMINTSVGGDAYKDKVNEEVRLLEEQLTKLSGISSSIISSDWDTTGIEDEYGNVAIVTFGQVFINQLTALLDTLNQQAQMTAAAKMDLETLITIAKELIGINGIYDENLNSVVASDKLYAPTYMSLSSELSVMSLTALIEAGENFTSGMSSADILKAVKGLVKFLEAVVEFLAAVVMWATDAIVTIAQYSSGGLKEMYNSLLLYGYAAYNLPNRTTIYDKKSLSGYSYDDIFDKAGGRYSADSFGGSLATMASFGNGEGSDAMFKGAEGEYILVGSNSELQNQAVAFFDLYVLRLLLDIVQVFKAPEVSALAALAGPCAIVVKILVALAEPMLDTIVITNGGKQYLVKKTIYFSYAGVIHLGNDLVDVSCVSDNLKEKIKDLIKTYNGSPDDNGYVDLSYNEYLLILSMLMVDQQEYMQRLRNLIQMEAAEEYKDKNGFHLQEAYTYVKSDVTYDLNPMFNLDGLNDSGVFTVDISRYSGY